MGLGGKDVSIEEGNYTLPEPLKKVALEELREDDYTRQQSLEQMRDWISKQAHIKNCRTDAPFLLRFLRTKKFSVPQACELLERYLTIRQLYPSWFNKLDCDEKELAEIIDSGYIVPLLDRHNGKLVIFTCADRFDPFKYTAAHMVKIHSIVTETLMDDEANQINGYIYVNDVAGFQMAHISLWSLKDVRNIVRCVQNTSPMRHKEHYLLNLPLHAAKLVEFTVSMLSDKLRSRNNICKNLTELHEKIDPKILPKEYGGTIPLSEMIEQFKIKLKENRDNLLALDDMQIDLDENNCKLFTEMDEELGVGIEGSFKQLQVD